MSHDPAGTTNKVPTNRMATHVRPINNFLVVCERSVTAPIKGAVNNKIRFEMVRPIPR